jgi:hypothetical protein
LCARLGISVVLINNKLLYGIYLFFNRFTTITCFLHIATASNKQNEAVLLILLDLVSIEIVSSDGDKEN